MDETTSQWLIQSVSAVGIGAFIGLEREHAEVEREGQDGVPPVPVMLGVRTFALISLLGWMSALLGEDAPAIPILAGAVIGAIVALKAKYEIDRTRGLTTEVAAFATLLLGMLVRRDLTLAVTLALFVTLLLIAKPWFRSFVPRMRRMDLTATLQLAIVFAIVLPLLPEPALDPWQALSPKKLGFFVALVGAISYVGYVLHRLVGSQRGAGLTGLLGGLVSSTAVTAAMAEEVKRSANMLLPGELAVLLACSVMHVRVLVVAALLSPAVARSLALPLGVMLLATLLGAGLKWRALKAAGQAPAKAGEAQIELSNPFSLLPALKMGALLAVILVVSALARQFLGNAGLYLTSIVTGLVDVDAITLVAAREAGDGQLPASAAALAISLAVVANTLVKTGIGFISGGKRFGLDLGKVLIASVGLGLLTAVAVELLH